MLYYYTRNTISFNSNETHPYQLRITPDYGRIEIEWAAVLKVLEQSPTQAAALFEWAFAKYKEGYTDTRVQAGRQVLKDNPQRGWLILEQLIVSDNPDDRDTALTLLAESGDPRAYPLVKPLLQDPWPYLQLDAAGFLKDIYSDEVVIALQNLLDHGSVWVGEAAQLLLQEMNVAENKSA